MQKNEVKSLIESIKSQTEQLKNTVRNCVGIKKISATSPSNEPSSSISKKPFSRKKLNHEISEVILRAHENLNDGTQQQYPELLKEIIQENEELKQELQTLKKCLMNAVNQCKLLKRELEEEKRKTSRFTVVENEFLKEKRKNSFLSEKNFELKKQALSLMTKIKTFLANCEKDSLENLQENAKIFEENQVFRDILNKPPSIDQNSEAKPQEPSKTLKELTEDYKKSIELRKENREKMKIEAKNKEKISNIFSYFQGNSQNEIQTEGQSNSQSIIDMYEEKILQNSIKSAGSGNNSLNISVGSMNSNKEKSPLLSGTLKKK